MLQNHICLWVPEALAKPLSRRQISLLPLLQRPTTDGCLLPKLTRVLGLGKWRVRVEGRKPLKESPPAANFGGL